MNYMRNELCGDELCVTEAADLAFKVFVVRNCAYFGLFGFSRVGPRFLTYRHVGPLCETPEVGVFGPPKRGAKFTPPPRLTPRKKEFTQK